MTGIYVTGSIATDHLMTFPGSFTEQLIADRLDTVSLSFLVDDLVVRHGGVAANIAYGLALLGRRPRLVGAVGADFDGYRRRLEHSGVDCSAVHVSRTAHTARFICTTDARQCQIASFYPGAMAEAAEIDLAGIVGATRPELVIVAPDAPGAMVRHAAACREHGWPFAADPSQQIARMSGPEIKEFVSGADYLMTNEYELDLLLEKCGIREPDLPGLVGTVVTTRGERGVRIRDRHGETSVPAAPIPAVVDPTGGGDAFRSGFVAGIAWGLTPGDAAAVGCQVAAFALRHEGSQEYAFTPEAFCSALVENYRDTRPGAVSAAVLRLEGAAA
ncbi:adenosine kinase [Actinoplanes campanulatus]|uniref:Adenosine kinase n=1 Tax=Actinoplanes campanulatus TaxID=113559 RepID=A0A7W5AIV1_9ACTN|nr:carbohydrate kinase family protein [Actinoplanes campanulatus]MBB3096930.1 adenosine kinase [Actinoplanes campanulatus]GGN44935.1 adenosine kinase [Actinoplanes campanulatus]GID37473.1 adenosine kinase [Actinoplanes campanulatus]